MKIYDISQEVFSCRVYPGDPAPKKRVLCSMEKGELYNLTAFDMCAHNGTHIDGPFHFFREGETVEQVELTSFVGPAYVAQAQGRLGAEEAQGILERAKAQDPAAAQRILLQGEAEVTRSAARVFAQAGIGLLGTESQSVGPLAAPMEVHRVLLGARVILLEGLCLKGISPGAYFLCAAPLKLAGADGAPCRALLIC